MARCARASHTVVLVAVSLFLLAPAASAQLPITQWQASTQVHRDQASDVDSGFPPGPITSSLQDVSATIVYGPPGPPSTVIGSASGEFLSA